MKRLTNDELRAELRLMARVESAGYLLLGAADAVDGGVAAFVLMDKALAKLRAHHRRLAASGREWTGTGVVTRRARRGAQ